MIARHEPEEILVVATTNRGKLAELTSLLAGLRLQVRSIDEVMKHPPRVAEDGATFLENALKKARAVARATRLLTLADDSGLEVDALGGRPGVWSARFAHEGASDAENRVALLAAIDAVGVPSAKASVEFAARFRCVLALVDGRTRGSQTTDEPSEGPTLEYTADGSCEGAIRRTPRGMGGFGYDPLFVLTSDEAQRTMAELSEEEKNRISHRARAFAALRPLLERVLARRADALANVE